ncbi:peptidase M28 [Allochromatium vinosum DSM 180]|uniref:Peptidase M28 n=2 Tax=Allochromatium vinosum TaxID=1049 RepID=D3RNN4_ALLVD|nr:peptidase M28 [Allochromatium vinosum DSM 180]
MHQTGSAGVWALVVLAALLWLDSPRLLADPAHSAPPLIRHQLEVRLDPESGRIEVRDQMRLPESKSQWSLILHTGLEPRLIDGEATLTHVSAFGHLAEYRLHLKTPGAVTLAYGGRIRHDLERIDESLGRARQWSRGTIAPAGVFLDGGSGWYPRIPDSHQSFSLDVRLPEGWSAITQGTGTTDPATGQSHWSESQPQDDIYLIAGRFHAYHQRTAGVQAEAQVYLREPDTALAKRYLDATLDYLALYSDLIGPYPFAKFALVENFWESGYGMPSFTLLGPRVIRLPFILQTSYPHEILHNWWGNGVYVDYESGNWSEGLTNYLADYWLMERAGRGVEGRRDMLKSFADYVRRGRDFPLAEFVQRHGADSQAIGYNKGAMVFHMLRRELGDETFIQGLRRFYADNRFRAAGYADLRRAFERVSGRNLGAFFAAWVERAGAPHLALEDVETRSTPEGYRISGRIRQTQPEPPFPLSLPVAIDLDSGQSVIERIVSRERETRFDIALRSAPVRLRIDPDFEVFRALAPGELPVTLSNLFGADQGLILIPADAPDALRSGYRRLAETWRAGHPDWRVAEDREFDHLPDDRPIWLLGWENRHLATFARDAAEFSLTLDIQRLALSQASEPSFVNTDLAPETDSAVLTRRIEDRPVAWLATRDPGALPALARKLPHYGQYSYLIFNGPEAINRLKGQWPSGDSALSHRRSPSTVRAVPVQPR